MSSDGQPAPLALPGGVVIDLGPSDGARCPIDWATPTVDGASGLFGPLVAHLSQPTLSIEERRRAEAVLCDVLVPLPTATLSPPLPVDERARKVAGALLADITDRRPLTAWGRDVGAGARTLARLFVAETGRGFERWRSTARLAAAAAPGIGHLCQRHRLPTRLRQPQRVPRRVPAGGRHDTL